MDAADPIRPGVALTYTLTITNNSGSNAINVVVTDTLPASVVYSAANPSAGNCTYSGQLTNLVSCSGTSLAGNSSLQIEIFVNVKTTATGQLNNRGVVASGNPDPNPGNNTAQAITTIDSIVPQVDWVSPVQNGSGYFAGNEFMRNLSINLVAQATDNIAIEGVRFYRWDKAKLRFVDLGYVSQAPYQWGLDARLLYGGWNEFDVEAYDTAGNISVHKYIFLFRPYVAYLPLTSRNP
jgi:uncharacterized repeat protein (TIGR01451 family)